MTDTTETGTGDGDGDGEPIALQGAVQKGPLIIGASIQVSPVDVLGQPTGDIFATQTINDRGEFSLAAIPQGYVFIEGSGYFYNEVMGTISNAPLTLRAYHRHTPDNDAVVLNLLTQLASGRVVNLLGEGVDADAAVMQSEAELRTALGIGVPSGVLGPMIELDLMGDAQFGNAYLLAVSAVFIQAAITQAGPNGPVDGELQQLVNTITLDLATDGQLPTQTVTMLQQAEFDLDPTLVEANLATRAAELAGCGSSPRACRTPSADCRTRREEGVCRAQATDEQQRHDEDACTIASVCMAGECLDPDAPGYVLHENFSGDAPGWTLGPEWEIGPALASDCSQFMRCKTEDPGSDHTPTDDNRLAGILIGACTPTWSTETIV